MEFRWDPRKDALNKDNHGIGFETASLVFSDPFHVTVHDRIVDSEQRWRTMGQVGGLIIIVVIHTYIEKNGQEIIRIISARKATKREGKHYEGKNN